MSNLAERKLQRNTRVLERYRQLREVLKMREAKEILKNEFGLELSTIEKILHDPKYSNSPLKQPT